MQVLAVVFKAIAIMTWVASLVILVGSLSEIPAPRPDDGPIGMLGLLLIDSSVMSVLSGIVVGFILFGFGTVISLLNDIRRNTW
jgi:O-antigen/teichoic acid export membrane protein